MAKKVYVTDDGLDLQQLLEKFLLGALAFNQGADDYLDEGLDGDNEVAGKEGKAYTALEHAWDEGFGYFGAARDYADQTDAEIKAKDQVDTDDDKKIDFKSEYNFGASVNAGKRDVGSIEKDVEGAEPRTDFTGDAISAFLKGRQLIVEDADRDLIKAEATKAVEAWEKAIAATAVHYVNDTIEQIELTQDDKQDFNEYAKVWSELKGFALSFQFNPNSPMSDADFATLHSKIGDQPELAQDKLDDYKTALLAARKIMEDTYKFDKDVVEAW